LDTANTSSFNGSDLDVSLISPSSSPGVSDDPVVLSVLGSESNTTNSVIEVGSAGGIIENTARVHLEDHFVSFNSEGYWLFRESSLKLRDRVGWDVSVAGVVNLGFGRLIVAASSLSGSSRGVWVVSLELLSIASDVHESVGLETTIASMGVSVTRGNLLLRKGEESTGLEEVGGLSGEGSREGPAGTALSLILDWVDSTSGSPVDAAVGGLWKVDWLWLNLIKSFPKLWLVSKKFLVFSMGPGGHEVVSDGEGGLGGVLFLDESIFLEVLIHSESVLLDGSV